MQARLFRQLYATTGEPVSISRASKMKPERYILWVLGVLAFLVVAFGPVVSPVAAAQSTTAQTPTTKATLVFAQGGIAPGAKTVSGALVLELEPSWKTYWRSPGEVGIPPRFDWQGSENLKEARHLWPAPDRFTAFGIENFGYEKRVVSPIEFTLDAPGEPARIALKLDLLVCSDVCIPEKLSLEHDLPLGSELDPASAEVISAALATIPSRETPSTVSSVRAFVDADQTELIVSLNGTQPFDKVDLYPEFGEGTAFGKPDLRLSQDGTALWARFPINTVGESKESLLLTVTDGNHGAFTVSPLRLAVAPGPPFNLTDKPSGMSKVVWTALVAVLGGLILNVMPCVLPVLAIKVSSLVTSGGKDRVQVRTGLLATTFGVMLFMWLLAAVLMTLKSAGVSVGWGIQFQNPLFLIVLITLLMAFVGNLFGFFEITLPTGLQTSMSRVGGQSHLGDVFTGFFAAMLATPCSAPFLGTAVAFALAGSNTDISVVFTALGLGLALPYLTLALKPGLASALPKPGRWMVWVRIAMGLLLLGTVAWLAWVMNGVAGQMATFATLVIAAVIIGLLTSARSYGRIPVLLTIPVLAFGLVWTPSLVPMPNSVSEAIAPSSWVPFERSAIARHVSRGHVVFVDVTADWCVTCKANKALVLDREPVASALQADGIVAMQADWTRPSNVIARYLKANNRFGIPFNAVYGPGAPEGIILPEVLSTQSVLDAIVAAKPIDLRARLKDLAEL